LTISIERLEISGLRNFCHLKLEDCRRVNILSGPNGAGKTSILEAIYLLGFGRSFRGNQLVSAINHSMSDCVIYCELKKNTLNYHSLGVGRTRQGRQDFHVNKLPVKNITDLAKILPLQLINADTFALIGGGSKARRQFIDWGVFHVKPDFLGYWRTIQRSLRQRNHLLKQQKALRHGRIYPPEMAAWDRELVACSISIDELRRQYIDDIRPVFNEILHRLTSDLSDLSLEYQRGWKKNVELQAVFEENFERDTSLGSTTNGPHRANIDIRVKGMPAIDVLSRGQLKLVISSLKLAQGQLLKRQQGQKCIYLIDDLPAELDEGHRAALCALLDEMESQVFITTVDADVIENCWKNKSVVRQFHVEHELTTK